MEKEILEKLEEIKEILAKITGTSDLTEIERFSEEALAKAAKEYQDMVIKRGEWVSQNDLYQVSKIYSWSSGKFIIEKFGFKNYFRRGKNNLYFNRKDLIALKNELKERKIDLGKYMELEEDKEKFERYLSSIEMGEGKKKKKAFKIPEELRDIESKPYLIAEEIIRKDIENLKQEFNSKKLVQYIDLYEKGTYAIFKNQYYFEKYLEPGIKKDCKSWCERFNYANHALKNLKEIEKESCEQE